MRNIDTNKGHIRRTAGVLAALVCILLIPTVSLAAGFGPDDRVDGMRFATDLAFYAGAFSTAVTASVNPTATMAILSILGSIENASVYSPDSVFFTTIADFLNGVPIIREVGKLPIANPYAAIFLTLVAVAIIIIHSFAESKMVSEVTIDKLDKLVGYICTVTISLLPFVTNDALAKDPPGHKAVSALARTAVILGKPSKSSGPEWYTYVLAGISVIAITIFYYCIYTCVNNLEVIIAAIPVKGTSLIGQIVKALLHFTLILLQIFAPVISLILSIILSIAGVLLFGVLTRISQYYKDIYVYTVLRKIFKRTDPVPRIEKHVPWRIRRRFPDMEIAMSVYKLSGINKVPKRMRLWLIKDPNGVYLIRKRLIRKPVVIVWNDLKDRFEGRQFYFESCARFIRIRTEDKFLELIMSTRYKDELPMLAEIMDLKDFAPVSKEIKEAKSLKNRFRRRKVIADPV